MLTGNRMPKNIWAQKSGSERKLEKTIKNDFEIRVYYQMLRVDRMKDNGVDRTRSTPSGMRK
jgi:hypothetical protein